MKKVIALLGSKRKMNTYKLLLQIKTLLLEKQIDVEIIELYKYEIKDCTGCNYCVLKDKCVLKDDVCELMDKIALADGVIISSPVYLKQVSGKLKTFFDRTCEWFHRPVLTAKPVLAVATTKGSGLKETLDYILDVCVQWGGILGGKVGRSIFNLDKQVTVKELTSFINLLYKPQRYSPRLNELINFEVQKSLAVYLKGLDLEYWEKNKWIHRSYFYDCNINPVKKLVSSLIGNKIRKSMLKGPVLDEKKILNE